MPRWILVLLFPALSLAQPSLQSTPLSDIHISGDLSHRILLNTSRLTDTYYQPDHLVTISPDWPGDAVGREILALTLLAQSTGAEPSTLDPLLNQVAGHLNDHGYLGRVLPDNIQNEQYLSGHSWLLRGLCEHYAWKHDELSLSLIRKITTGLLLPAAGHYAHYPIRPEDRPRAGHVAGNITSRVDGWQLSTDVGCAFIMLDGVTRTLEINPSPQLESLIKEMIARYAQVDLVKVAAQTHATLSALRGILRFYNSHPDPAYLELVQRTYRLYFDTATTEHYANYNWFTRPQWTEACAVVDSFMLATQLFEETRDPRYLADAQLIYYNALCHAQRPNGGFGCDLCIGSSPTLLLLKPHDIYEAPFCCSMRGAEGLTAASTYCYLFSPRDSATSDIFLPFFHDNTAAIHLSNGVLKLAESTAYPLEGSVQLTVIESTLTQPATLHFFIPDWTPAASVRLTVNGATSPAQVHDSFVTVTRTFVPGDHFTLTFDVSLRAAAALHPQLVPGRVRYFHGPLLLARSFTLPLVETKSLASAQFIPIAPAVYRSTDPANPLTLSPIRDLTYRSESETRATAEELLFAR